MADGMLGFKGSKRQEALMQVWPGQLMAGGRGKCSVVSDSHKGSCILTLLLIRCQTLPARTQNMRAGAGG